MSDGGAMAKAFTREPNGFLMLGESDDELFAQVGNHIAETHPDLSRKLSHRKPAPASDSCGGDHPRVRERSG
jgi:hypothetical protein